VLGEVGQELLQQESALFNELDILVSDSFLLWNLRNVQPLVSLCQPLMQHMKVSISLFNIVVVTNLVITLQSVRYITS